MRRRPSMGGRIPQPVTTRSIDSRLVADSALIRAFWVALVRPGDVHEARLPKSRRGPRRFYRTVSGYFDDPDAFASALAGVGGDDAEAVYLTLNPVDPALKARAANRLLNGAPATTADADVLRLRHLLIDLDPVRPVGISATDPERDEGLAVRDAVRLYLRNEAGWPHPLAVTESGNGGGLIYRLDLPNDAASVELVAGVLDALSALFTTPRVKVDTTTGNASRITKVVGTIAAKGDDTPDRPWRLATGWFNPHPSAVSPEQIAAVRALAPVAEPARRPTPSNGQGGRREWDVRDVLRDNGIGFAETVLPYATALPLDRCLTSEDHADGAAILEFASGALAYTCRHERCRGKGWADVRGVLGLGDRGATEPTAGAQRRGDEAPTSQAPDPTVAAHAAPPWPTLDAAALHGLAGEVVRAFDPHTEADPVATLFNYLTMFGNAVGPIPHVLVGDRRHHANEFAILVGDTSKSRKGTSNDGPQAIVAGADPGWAARVQGGLSSGEGLIWAIRDPIEETKQGETVIKDPGESDKRLLAIEEEFSAVCRVATRDGNTLSETIRRAWDGKPLGNLTKNSPARCGAPHVSILAHVTQTELLRVIDSTDAANGFGNRFNWACVRRSKLLAEGGRPPEAKRADLVVRTRDALTAARKAGEVRRDAEARALWAEVYGDLSAPAVGLFGAMTDRAEAHVLRWSLLYALLDRSREITVAHLIAALALWDYAAASARFVFGDALGDPIADRVLAGLRNGGPLDRTQISELFGRHVNAARLDKALAALLIAGKARTWSEETGGRRRTMWAAK
jgi:hypothetical protein